ncbi:alpha-2-macroglobulin family protein [Chitinibacteraceae bacterium HSL-7]
MRPIARFALSVLLVAAPVLHAASIATFSPQGEVKRVDQVRVTFSAPVIAMGNTQAPAPLSWDCPLKGNGHWINDRSWVFDVSQNPTANVGCTFKPAAGWKALDGSTLPASTRYRFYTGAAIVERAWPSGGQIDEDQSFALRFNGPADALTTLYCQSSASPERIPVEALAAKDRKALLDHLELTDDATRVATVRCAQRLVPDSKLMLVHTRGKAKPDRFDYTVRPPFKATLSCLRENARGACIPFKPVTLQFSSPVPAELAAKVHLTVDGKERLPDETEDSRGDAVHEVSFKPPFPALSELELTLPDGFEDEIGRSAVNAGKFPLTFKTSDYPPLAKFAAAPFGIIEAGDDAMLPITLRGVEGALDVRGVHLAGKTLRVTDDQAMRDWLDKVNEYHESWVQIGKKSVETRRLSLLKNEAGASALKLPQSKDGRWPFEVVGTPLKEPGLYIVEVSSQLLGKALLGQQRPMYVRTAALVTNLGVHLKTGSDSAAVWVTTLDRGLPVAGAQVAIHDCSGKTLWQGKTGKSGIASVPKNFEPARCDGESRLFVTARAKDAQGRDDVSFVRSDWNEGIESWRFPFPTWFDETSVITAHTVFDRALFRAGETVSMKHFIRTRGTQGLKLLKAGALPEKLKLVHNGSGDEIEIPLSWRKGRYAESTYTLPKEAKLGSYSVYVERKAKRERDDYSIPADPALDGYQLASGSFRVEAFRLPTMTGKISTPKGSHVGGGDVPLDVSIAWGNGGPAKNWPVEVSAMLSDSYHRPQGYDDFTFRPPEKSRDDTTPSLDGKVVLDKAALTLDANGNGKAIAAKLPAVDRRFDLVSEVSYSDPNGAVQTISRRIALWPADVQVGLSVESWITRGRALPAKVVVLDTAGKPVAGQAVSVQLREHRYYSTRKRLVGGFYAWDSHEDVTDRGEVCSGTSDARGLVFCDVQLDNAGSMELVAVAKDKAGRSARAAQDVWVSRHDELWFDHDNNDRIDVLPEKPSYAPGEMARFQVRMPFRKASAWVAIEREGIMETRVVQLDGKNASFEIKVGPDWTPNVYVSVLAVRGRIRDVPWYSFFSWGWKTPRDWWQAFWHEGKDYVAPSALVDLGKPAFKYGAAEITVGDAARRLRIDVKPARATYSVREVADVLVTVRTPDGKPAPAGSEVTFAAVDEALLELQPNTSWDLLAAMNQRHSWGIDTATAQLQVVGKRHYGRKALPAGGGGGKAPTRELLDTLLTWQPSVKLDAQGQARIKVPINDALTRFRLVAVADAGTQLFGSGEATITVRQDLQLTSALPPAAREGDRYPAGVTVRNGSDRAMKVEVSASAAGLPALAKQVISLPAGESRLVSWPVAMPLGLASSAWTFGATEVGGKARDQLALTQAIESALPVTVEQATLERLDSPRSIAVAQAPGAVAGRGGVRVLLQDKLGRDLPAVRRWFEAYPYSCLEQRTSVAVGLNDATRWQALMGELPLYLDADGLAGYFPLSEGREGSDVLTSYVLAISHEAGFALPDAARGRMLDGLAAFVEGRLKRSLYTSRQDLAARKLAALDALARYQRFKPAMLDSLDPNPQTMSTAMLVDWLSLLTRVSAIPQRDARVLEAGNLLRARLTYQGTRMVFSTEADDAAWWLMGSGDVNAARLLLAARSLADWAPDLSRVLTGLLARQERGHWGTTTANAWGTLAVARFSQQFESTAVAGRTRAQLGNSTLAQNWPKDGVTDLGVLAWPAGGKGTVTLAHEGSGAPWATVQVEAAIKLSAPRVAGYRIEKSIEPVSQKTKGRYQPGDVARVKIKVQAQADMTWVVVNDPIPAGATIQGGGLGRDSAILASQQGDEVDGADYIERTFTGYRAYYGYVPRGEMTLEYLLRFNTAGTFQLPPTRVEAMYAPDVFGMLPNAPFTVAP